MRYFTFIRSNFRWRILLFALLCLAAEGAHAAGAFSITGSSSGDTTSLTLTASVQVASEDAGRTGAVYVAATVAGLWFFQGPAGNWTAWTGGAFPSPVYSGALGSHAISVADRMDLSSLPGTDVYVGYGLDAADMLSNVKFARIYTVPATAVPVARSALQRNTSPTVSEADKATLVADDTAFTLDLYRELLNGPANANVFFSPHSISIALAMTYAGARGATGTEMASTLHFTLPQDRLHPAFDWLDLALMSRGQGALGRDGQPFRLRVSNSLWGDKASRFEAAFLDTLAWNYDAGMNLVDFRGDPETGRTRINAWVAEQTEQRIRDLLAPGSVDTLTRLVLVNAVYFNAAWQSKFAAGATASDTFTKLDGSSVQVDMMNQETFFPYAEGADYQVIELPYDGGELGMLIVLPAAGHFEQFERSLGADALKSVLAALRSENVRLGLPKFRIEDSFSLSATMQRLGMRAAFSDAADFSGISSTERLLIRDIVHKAYIDIDENGTEAAAATAVIIGTTSLPPPPKIFKANRPFLLAIVDKNTGAIVFWGRVVDPKGLVLSGVH